jgi:DNA primase large subunit
MFLFKRIDDPLSLEMYCNRFDVFHRYLLENRMEISQEEMMSALEHIQTELQEQPSVTDVPKEKVNRIRELMFKYKDHLKHEPYQACPPCMAKIFYRVKEGTAKHQGLFSLSSFLYKLELPADEILGVFAKPGKYVKQLEAIKKSHEEGFTEYSAPECSTMKRNGLCSPGGDNLCAKEWMTHPGKYYSMLRMREAKKEKDLDYAIICSGTTRKHMI